LHEIIAFVFDRHGAVYLSVFGIIRLGNMDLNLPKTLTF
jgi:hypothetical protein